MRFIAGPVQLPYPPRACVVSNRTDGDFIDFNTVIDKPEPTRLYMRRSVVEEAAQLLGMVPGKEVDDLRRGLDALSTELQETQEQMSMYAEFEEKFGLRKVAA